MGEITLDKLEEKSDTDTTILIFPKGNEPLQEKENIVNKGYFNFLEAVATTTSINKE